MLNGVCCFKVMGGQRGVTVLHFYLLSQLDGGQTVRLPNALREPSQFNISS